MNNRILVRAAAIALTAGIGFTAQQDARAQAFQFPSYEADILECGSPELIQARVVVDILSTQLLDAELALAMHAANRAEALRRPDPDADYVARMGAALEDDRARVAELEGHLRCWRQRYDDLLAERPVEPLGDPTIRPPEAEAEADDQWADIDPAVLDALDFDLDVLLAAVADYQNILSNLDAAIEALEAASLADDGRAPAIGPTGGIVVEPDAGAVAEARADAADRLDALSEVLGPLQGAVIGADGESASAPAVPSGE